MAVATSGRPAATSSSMMRGVSGSGAPPMYAVYSDAKLPSSTRVPATASSTQLAVFMNGLLHSRRGETSAMANDAPRSPPHPPPGAVINTPCSCSWHVGSPLGRGRHGGGDDRRTELRNAPAAEALDAQEVRGAGRRVLRHLLQQALRQDDGDVEAEPKGLAGPPLLQGLDAPARRIR